MDSGPGAYAPSRNDNPLVVIGFTESMVQPILSAPGQLGCALREIARGINHIGRSDRYDRHGLGLRRPRARPAAPRRRRGRAIP